MNTDVAIRFLTQFFALAQGDVYISSLPNERGQSPPERHIITRDSEKVARFCEKWDQIGRGLFFCIATLRPGAQPTERGSLRCKANAAELPAIHVDIDFDKIDTPADNPQAFVVSRLESLRIPPSITVASGGGVHAYWMLDKPIDVSVEAERAEILMRSQANLVAGDPAVCEVARLMRLPGSTNSKRDESRPVMLLKLSDSSISLDKIERNGIPVIEYAEKAEPGAANPFLTFAARTGFKPPIDVEASLSGMRFKGGKKIGVHPTQVSVTGSLIRAGHPLEEVVERVLAATMAVAPPGWSIQRERAEIEGMCRTWQANQAKVTTTTEETVAAPESNVVQMVRPKPKPLTTDKPNLPRIVADGVIEQIRQTNGDILLTGGTCHLYRNGIWSPVTAADEQQLKVIIQEGFEALSQAGDVRSLNATWKRLMEHPRLYERDVAWDPPGFVVVANGSIKIDKTSDGPFDPMVVTFQPVNPSLRATRRIGAPYDPEASCPIFLDFLDNLFADEGESARIKLISLLQQFFGASLCVNIMQREQRRALIIFGKSRSGKSAIARIFEKLMGDAVASPSLTDINEKFGMEKFIGASAWVRDDAINEGDKIDAQRFKTLVTGEAIEIRRMARISLRVSMNIPILLTSNPLPRTTDLSDAVFNRSLLINLNHVFTPEDAIAERHRLGIKPGEDLGARLFEMEAPGILNWALRGLELIFNRGAYDIPEDAESLLLQFKDDNNPVSAWARDAILEKPFGKVARSDLLCAYHGWQREQEGDEARAMGGRAFFPRLRAECPHSGDAQEHDGTRYVTGIALTDEALQLWRRHSDNPLKSGTKGTSLSTGEVNRVWAGKVADDV